MKSRDRINNANASVSTFACHNTFHHVHPRHALMLGFEIEISVMLAQTPTQQKNTYAYLHNTIIYCPIYDHYVLVQMLHKVPCTADLLLCQTKESIVSIVSI